MIKPEDVVPVFSGDLVANGLQYFTNGLARQLHFEKRKVVQIQNFIVEILLFEFTIQDSYFKNCFIFFLHEALSNPIEDSRAIQQVNTECFAGELEVQYVVFRLEKLDY